jgi:hypothetical protein
MYKYNLDELRLQRIKTSIIAYCVLQNLKHGLHIERIKKEIFKHLRYLKTVGQLTFDSQTCA